MPIRYSGYAADAQSAALGTNFTTSFGFEPNAEITTRLNVFSCTYDGCTVFTTTTDSVAACISNASRLG